MATSSRGETPKPSDTYFSGVSHVIYRKVGSKEYTHAACGDPTRCQCPCFVCMKAYNDAGRPEYTNYL